MNDSGRPAAGTMLIVDDEADVLTMLGEHFEARGFAVTEAATAAAALQAIGRDRFDLVLLDIVLPDLDGITVLREIRHQCPDLPVIVITGYDVPSAPYASCLLGAREYLRKPIDLEQLDRVARATIGRARRGERERASSDIP